MSSDRPGADDTGTPSVSWPASWQASCSAPDRGSLGTVLYAPDSDKSPVLQDFAAALRRRGWRVHGVGIETDWDGPPGPATRKAGLRLVDLADGRRYPLARPVATADGTPPPWAAVGGPAAGGLTAGGLAAGGLADGVPVVANGDRLTVGRWAIDPAVLAAADRRLLAVAAAPATADLVVVDKFGPLEARGGGLAAGLAAVLRAGLPVLVTVRSAFLDGWDRFARAAGRGSDGGGVLLRATAADLWRWWGPERLAEELRRSVPDGPVHRLVVGRNWTLVAGADGVGLALSPARDAPGCRPVPAAGQLAARGLAGLAALTGARNPVETAIGWAAVNAHVNAPARLAGLAAAGITASGVSTSGVSASDVSAAGLSTRDGFAALAAVAAAPGRPLVTVGRFPTGGRQDPLLADPVVIEQEPGDGDWPAVAAARLLPQAGRVLLTASTLGNGTLPGLLRLCAEGLPRPVTALVGPGTPMTPALHNYGLDVLAGFEIIDAAAAERAVAEGGSLRALRACGRKLSLVAPDR